MIRSGFSTRYNKVLFCYRLEDNPHPSMFGTGPEKGTFEHIASKVCKIYHIYIGIKLYIYHGILLSL